MCLAHLHVRDEDVVDHSHGLQVGGPTATEHWMTEDLLYRRSFFPVTLQAPADEILRVPADRLSGFQEHLAHHLVGNAEPEAESNLVIFVAHAIVTQVLEEESLTSAQFEESYPQAPGA